MSHTTPADPHVTVRALFPKLAREYAYGYGVTRALGGHERSNWAELANYAHVRAYHTARNYGVTIQPVPIADPYADASAQAHDIGHGRLLVSTLYCDHPLWTADQNVSFRAWHDLEHFAHGTDFSPEGELETFQRSAHAILTDGTLGSADAERAVRALFSESVYQLAYAVDTGDFLDPQRCVLPGLYGNGAGGAALLALLDPPEPF